MAALLVSMSVMAVLMAAALPVWSHVAQREKEEELIWRGEQYRRAIMLFQRRYANTFPPTIDILVEQKFLRKKYKDPITDDDFQIIPVGGAVAGGRPGMPTTGAGAGPSNAPGGMGAAGGRGATQPGAGPGTTPSSSFGQATQPAMGIQGVTSKSKDTSIKLYNGMDRYNQWAFVYLAASTQAGAGGAGFARPGMGGAPGGGAGQPFGQPGGGFGQPGGGFGQPGGGFGQPGGGFGQPGGGFGQPGGSGQPFGQPGQQMPPGSPGGFGAPPTPGGSIFTPVNPSGGGQTRPPVGGFGSRPPGE